MDLILTPLVTRFLRQYVRHSSEGAGSDLKVRRRTAGSLRWLPAAAPVAAVEAGGV